MEENSLFKKGCIPWVDLMQKTSFIGQSLNFGKTLFATKTEQNTLLKRETYYISRFEETRIVKRELVKIWRDALLEPKLSKTHFSSKSCTPWVHSMQNAFFSDKWWNSGKNAVFNPKLRKHTFHEKVVFHEWVWCKVHFSARSGKNSATCFFQVTMEQNTLFKKELYSLSGLDAKSIF